MRVPAVSFVYKLAAAMLAVMMMFSLVPADALAEGESSGAVEDEAVASDSTGQMDGFAGSSGEPQGTGAEQGGEGLPVAPTLASGLVGKPSSFVSVDVAFDGEPIVGSFTVDGMTFAVTDGSDVVLVGVAGAEGAFGSEVPTSPQPPSAPTTEAEASSFMLPESVAYGEAEYSVVSIGAYAFYLSGVTDVSLPASIVDVDDRAFRSSDVASVTVAGGNPVYSSFDGALYSADMRSLLLIPGGKQGAVLLAKEAESAEASVFSHCSLVDAISVEEGGAAFASENGLLYDSDLTTLLRVPAGATEITIREGCTTIAAGAMEACASLTAVNAPATVNSISPDVFHAIPTVSLPAASVILGGDSEAAEAEEPDDGQASESDSQLTAMVALSSIDDDLPEVEPTAIALQLSADADASPWRSAGFSTEGGSFISKDGENGSATSAPVAASMVSQDVKLATEGAPTPLRNDTSNEASSDIPVASLDAATTYAAAPLYYWRSGVIWSKISTNSGSSWGGWKDYNSGSGNGWISNGDAARYRFYKGNAWKNSNGANWARWCADQSYGVWDHCYVASSASGPWTPVADSSSWRSIASDTYIAFWCDDGNNMKTVTLDKEGGSGGTGSPLKWAPIEKSTPKITPPTLSGWTFSGYVGTPDTDSAVPYLYVGADGSPTSQQTASFGTGTTLYAAWTKPVAFNANGGTQGKLKSLTARKGAPLGLVCDQVAATNPSYPLRSLFQTSLTPSGWKPTRTGYTFAGFYDTNAASGGTQWVDASGNLKVATCPTDTPSTLYARWTANKYDVSFNANGGSGGQSVKVQATSGSAMPTITTNKPTRTGYTFMGWYDNANYAASGAKQYYTAACASARNWDKAQATTLYAGWKANTITLTWNSQGGSAVANTAQTYASGTKVKLPANPTRAGYTFKGWFTAASGGTQITANTALPASNATYHAQWTANTIRTTWNVNGGKIDGNAGPFTRDTVYGSKTLGNAWDIWAEGRLTRPGYTFDGWYTAASGGTKVTQSTALPSTNAAYWAHWKAKTITLEWDPAWRGVLGPEPGVLTDQVYSEGAKLAPPQSPVRDGYYFAGWFTAASGGTQVTNTTALPTANATYYAHWVAKGPKVQFHAQGTLWYAYEASDGFDYGPAAADYPLGNPLFSSGVWLDAAGRVACEGAGAFADFPKELRGTVAFSQSMTGVTSAWLVTGDAQGNKAGSWLSSSGASVVGKASADVYLNGYGASTITWDAQGGECATATTPNVMPYDTAASPEPKRAGFVFEGWYDGTGDDAKLACKAGQRTPQITADITYYARWAPAIRADAPISATVRLDVLGVEDQAMDEEAPGYLESRCGEPLKVAEVAFEKKPGAAGLFGAHVPDIELQALPGKDASWAADAPAFSFALDAAGDAATEDDATKLAPLSMSGYEVRIPISYRFLIPDALLDEVLDAIDPTAFEDKKTPVCSVVYTVALQNPPA